MISNTVYDIQEGVSADQKTRNEILDDLKSLVWDDSEAFYSLLANCVSSHPVKMSERAKQKLLKLRLVDAQGFSPPTVRNIAENIASRISQRAQVNRAEKANYLPLS